MAPYGRERLDIKGAVGSTILCVRAETDYSEAAFLLLIKAKEDGQRSDLEAEALPLKKWQLLRNRIFLF
jgi:hypothetical protein